MGSSGIINAAIIYAKKTGKPALKKKKATQINLTIVTSISKYSAKPPHTPAKVLLCLDLYNFLYNYALKLYEEFASLFE